MSLKSLINALFKLSGGQAMPDISSIVNISIAGTYEYVAPDNGYVCIQTYNQASTWKRLSIVMDKVDLLNDSRSIYWASGWFPVKKGDTVIATFGENDAQEDVPGYLTFVRLVGGHI